MSTALRITGWRTGLKKIQMTKLLKGYAPLSLAEAKSVTDRVRKLAGCDAHTS